MNEIGSGTASEWDRGATERGSGGGIERGSGTRRGGATAGDPLKGFRWACKEFYFGWFWSGFCCPVTLDFM